MTNAPRPSSQQQGTISKKNTIPQNPPPTDDRVIATYALDPGDPRFTPNQKYDANSLSPEWENASGKISTNTNWTSKPTNYFVAEDSKKFTLKSIVASRDMEVDTWTAVGYTYLRLTDDGKAIYFEHNANRGNGYLSVGLATGVNEATEAPQGRYELYKNLDLLGTVEGYQKKPTDDDYFTFGVDGFDIYVKFNGKEIVRFQDYRHMAEGKIALKHSAGIGLRKTGVRHYKDQVLFSDIKNNVLDLRDFGLRDIKTSGSIQGGSNQLRLGAPTKFKKGDYVIVELGSEAGGGKRGTVGVGGSWPAKKYATIGERDLDKSQPANTFALLEADGAVYRWDGTAWRRYVGDSKYFQEYFVGIGVPLALKAKILEISSDGFVLTLDKNAVIDASNANVYLDNSFVINKLGRAPKNDAEWNFPQVTGGTGYLTALTPSNVTLKVPAGNYAVGEQLLIEEHSGWKIIGAGKDQTRLFSPKGVPSASLTILASPNAEVRDLHLEGNARDEGFGFITDELYFKPIATNPITQTNMPINAQGFPWGIQFTQGSHNGVAENVKVTDVFSNAVGAWFSDNVWAKDVEVIINEGRAAIEPWFFQWAAAKGGGCNGCSFKSTRLVGAFSSFKSTGTQFINSRSVNGILALNSAGDFLIKDMKFEIFPNSQKIDISPIDGKLLRYYSEHHPIIDINTNIGPAYGYQANGGLIENVKIQSAFINANNDILTGININKDNPNITVRGGVYSAPDYQPPSLLVPMALNSTARNTVVDGFWVIGKSNPQHKWGYGNINLTNGVVENSVADVIKMKGTNPTDVVFENNRPNSNQAPLIDAIESKSIDEGNELKFQVTVSDANNSTNDTLGINQKHTFSLEAGTPEGMAIHAETGEVTWTPKEEQGLGNYTVTVKVTDSGVAPLVIDGKQVWPGQPPLSAAQSFTITVNEANTAPVIQTIADQTIEEGKELRIPVIATDTDKPAQALTYSLDTGAPQGASIDPNTGIFTWTPTSDQGRDEIYPIGVKVTDNSVPPLSDVKNFRVTVRDVPQPEPEKPVTIAGKALPGGPAFPAGKEFLVTVTGEPNRTYRVESTQDLVNWTALGTVTTDASGSGELPDPSAPSASFRFYRAVTI